MFLKRFAILYLFLVVTEARRNRILGGSEADPHEFPHMVTLNSGGGSYHICGGAILNENWVITAGHCPSLVPTNWEFRIKAGKHSIKTVEDTEQVINVSKIFVHENYTSDVAPNDIALLKLEQPLVFNEYVKSVALPESNSEVVGQVVLSGWGKQTEYEPSLDKLQKGYFIAIDSDNCQKIDELLLNEPSTVTDTMLCVMSPSLIDGTFACPGDSGGPLIKEENQQIRLVGVFSWLFNPCGQLGAPSVFTKVSSYVDWIQKIIANN